MDPKELLTKASNIKINKNRDSRSPHKPLLILLMLFRLQEGHSRLVLFEEIEERLANLLITFGPKNSHRTPELPFYHLKNDGFWEISNSDQILTTSKTPSAKLMRETRTLGGFSKEAYDLLAEDDGLAQQLASLILSQHFPSTIWQEILLKVGLEIDSYVLISDPKKTKRDHSFRKRILEAYDHSCAVCDFRVKMGNDFIALEAAHIKWIQHDGPNIESNGLSLCVMHHKLLDLGAITLNQDLKIIVSEQIQRDSGYKNWIEYLDGKSIKLPKKKVFAPNPEFLRWHVKEIFKDGYLDPTY